MSPLATKILEVIRANPRGDNCYNCTEPLILDAADGDPNAAKRAFEELVESRRARERSLGGYTIEVF